MDQQQLDNFFRDKLQNYQKPAPQGAWNKIESALEKKTERKFVWWKVAAVFFLLAGVGYLFLFNNINSEKQQLAEAEAQQRKALENFRKPQVQESVEQAKPENLDEAEISARVEPRQSKVVRKEKSEKRRPAVIEKQQATRVPTEDKSSMTDDIHVAQDLPVESNNPTVEPARVTEQKSTITLTFSSEQTSQYLNKNTLAEATSAEKKPSSLKKFLQKAGDLKSNQDPFGDLRERKNEILALSFKNDKRGQNK